MSRGLEVENYLRSIRSNSPVPLGSIEQEIPSPRLLQHVDSITRQSISAPPLDVPPLLRGRTFKSSLSTLYGVDSIRTEFASLTCHYPEESNEGGKVNRPSTLSFRKIKNYLANAFKKKPKYESSLPVVHSDTWTAFTKTASYTLGSEETLTSSLRPEIELTIPQSDQPTENRK